MMEGERSVPFDEDDEDMEGEKGGKVMELLATLVMSKNDGIMSIIHSTNIVIIDC